MGRKEAPNRKKKEIRDPTTFKEKSKGSENPSLYKKRKSKNKPKGIRKPRRVQKKNPPFPVKSENP